MRRSDFLGEGPLTNPYQTSAGKLSPAAVLRETAQHGATTAQAIATVIAAIQNTAPQKFISAMRRLETEFAARGHIDPSSFVAEFGRPSVAPSIVAFTEQFKIVLGASDLDELMASRSNRTLVENLLVHEHFAAMWSTWGCPVFNLTHSLAAALVLTEPPPIESFRVPFPTFAIVLPEGFLPFWHEDAQTWSTLLTYHEWRSDRLDAIAQLTAFSEEYTVYRRRPKTRLCDAVSEHDVPLRVFEDDPPLTNHDDITLQVATRLVQNVVAWVTTHGLEHGGKKQRERGKASTPSSAREDAPTTYVLGREIKISPELRRVASEVVVGASKNPVPGWRARVGHVVIGHWWPRDPAQIPRRGARRFVGPYWRGPEGQRAWSHVYEVGDYPLDEPLLTARVVRGPA